MNYRYGAEITAALSAPSGEEVVGYHGTSLWAVLYAAKVGALPNRVPRERFLYYVPISRRRAWADAAEYARNNAIIHFAREWVPYESIEAVYAALDAGDPDIESVQEDVVEEDALHGVMVSLRRSVEALPDVTDPELSDHERCVRVGRLGLPVRHIARITPLGIRDEEILGDRGLLKRDR